MLMMYDWGLPKVIMSDRDTKLVLVWADEWENLIGECSGRHNLEVDIEAGRGSCTHRQHPQPQPQQHIYVVSRGPLVKLARLDKLAIFGIRRKRHPFLPLLIFTFENPFL
jgi:hypothetical protein